MRKVSVGQWVRVKVRGLPHAKIAHIMKDVDGGVVLDRGIQGFRCWNVQDLKPLVKKC